jgi:hypothetical protein
LLQVSCTTPENAKKINTHSYSNVQDRHTGGLDAEDDDETTKTTTAGLARPSSPPATVPRPLTGPHHHEPFYVRTPLLHSLVLSEMAGRPVYLKLENCQPTGSFSDRGLGNCIKQVC